MVHPYTVRPATADTVNGPRNNNLLGQQRCSSPNPARFQYLVGRLHALGPRPTYELLKEVEAGADVVARLEVYARLDGDFIRALGGDKLSINSVSVLDGGRP